MDDWLERAQSCEAQLATLKQAYQPAIERVKEFKKNFGIREKADGEIIINFDKLVDNLGCEAALELRKIIDEKYNITGKDDEKYEKTQIELAV